MWLVGQVTNEDTLTWDFQGIFDSREKALAACRTRLYFISPVELNINYPHKTVAFTAEEYPFPDRVEME